MTKPPFSETVFNDSSPRLSETPPKKDPSKLIENLSLTVDAKARPNAWFLSKVAVPSHQLNLGLLEA